MNVQVIMTVNINNRLGHHRISTMVPVNASPVFEAKEENGLQLPDFTRLPKTGEVCRFTGLTRSTLNQLILGENPPVKSLVIKQDGSKRGIRLVHLPSLLDYLFTEMDEQAEGGQE
jgi:hypothetical protein